MKRVPSPVLHRSSVAASAAVAAASAAAARTSAPGAVAAGLRASALALLAGAMVVGGAAGATAAPGTADDGATDYGNGCVIDPSDKAVTLNSLRTHCTAEQQDAVYRAADAGAAPAGVTDGWVVRPGYGGDLAPLAWLGKTFATGPDGGTLTNRLSNGVDAWPAEIYRTTSIADGAPAWALNYAPSPTPQVYDEIREIVPGVWFGYSWWRQAGTDVLLLTFALSN